ncbi:MAG: cytidylyltransferase domain-containing protein [Spirochaetota bacterium]
MKADTHIILQVRYASTRLPAKLLLPLGGLSIYEQVLTRLLACREAGKLVVATTRDTEQYIRGITARYPVSVTLGSEQDVLGRYAAALREHGTVTVVRATGDNPLVCMAHADRAVRIHHRRGADLTVFPELPYGSGVEVVRAGALEEAASKADGPDEREHVTRYIYRHPHRFWVLECRPRPFYRRPDLRLTVDTMEDYQNMQDIYRALFRDRPIPLGEVIRYLDRRTAR